MANGHVYQPTDLVCASNRHELGTRLWVVNVESGRSVVCRVSDRGLLGNNVDLSPSAFHRIGDLRTGRLKVLIEEVKE